MSDKWYTGTHSLTLDEFPMVDMGKGVESNIITEYMTVERDGKEFFLLYPTMYQGKEIINPREYVFNTEKHFGMYDSKEELDKADKRIHEYFDTQRKKELQEEIYTYKQINK